MELDRIKAEIEAILFASGEPVPLSRLAEILEIESETVKKLCQALADSYDRPDCGLCLLILDGAYQLGTKKGTADAVKRAMEVRRNTPLSQAAMEVLAIIAYNQPVTRAFIEQVRGIDSSSTVAGLCEKGLVEEQGRLDLPGRPMSYGTTPNFLRCFGISSIGDLPPVAEFVTADEDDDEPVPVPETAGSVADDSPETAVE